jgi:chromosome condensin MukBEF MukE localization factor
VEDVTAVIFIDLFGSALDVDWQAEGDELLHHMWLALHKRVPMTGHRYHQQMPTASEPFFYHRFRATSDALISELALVPLRDGKIRALVRVASVDHIPSQIQPWADAITEASQRLSADHPEHQWYAMIGPTGTRARGAQVLTTGGVVGGMTVHPATSIYLDARDPRSFPRLSGFSYDVSFPVLVGGSSRGYDWSTASETAAIDLTKLCALLSLASGACWRLREVPDQHDAPIAHPRSRFGQRVFPETDDNYRREEVSFPQWAGRAWERLRNQPSLAVALHAYHQGLDLMEAFPSYALLAFVGTIEGIGAMSEPLRRCECCANCEQKVGAGRQFRNALRRVMPDAQAKELSAIYDYRSKTAHQGRLHGDELTRGAWGGARVFTPADAGDTFRHQTVWKLRDASQRLLLSHLA